jgi:hypothetical protein
MPIRVGIRYALMLLNQPTRTTMQTNGTMGQAATARTTNGHQNDSMRVTNVMVVYQDAHTRKWATNFYPSKVKGSQEVKCTWWNLNDFSEPGVLAGAVSTAIRADVIVVAVLTGTGLPFPFYVWVDAWLPHRKLTEGKLIALVGLAKHHKTEHDEGRTYLREMARLGHLNLIERDCPVPVQLPEKGMTERLSHHPAPLTGRQDFGKSCPTAAKLCLD